ncbi:hypothetical protein FRC96_17770 [Lujinxingia vulgaris]|uniref:AAA+ ATPase domain-containing protein n=1 Tax=Lujinxingia vulgaris TaxID=2600176 RepID=A0A5C6X390_9DELT|nr:hypothetical protein [Lujinxingia vulgaris]TXD32355.1 hypothetical protein FRC96_17770 [Lujinxingia vulgaris]
MSAVRGGVAIAWVLALVAVFLCPLPESAAQVMVDQVPATAGAEEGDDVSGTTTGEGASEGDPQEPGPGSSAETTAESGDEGSAEARSAPELSPEDISEARVEALRERVAEAEAAASQARVGGEVDARVRAFLQARLEEEPESRVAMREWISATLGHALREARAESAQTLADRSAETLQAVEAALQAQREAASQVDQEAAERLERSQRAQEAARLAVEQTRERERQERDAQIRQVLAREREIAEELLAISEQEGEQIRSIVEERRQSEATFSERRVEVEEGMTRPDGKLAEVVRQTLIYRRAARDDVKRTVQGYRAAERQVADLTPRLDEARRELEQLLQEVGQEPSTELATRRLALAKLQVELAEQRLQIARDVRDARRARNEVNLQRRAFFDESLEAMFPRLGAEARAMMLSPRSDSAWRDALEGVRVGVLLTIDTLEARWKQISDPGTMLTSVAFWGWVMGVFWRVIAILIALWFAREYAPRAVQWGLSQLLARRALRKAAGGLIKAAQVVRALIVPAVLYLAATHMTDYLVGALPELAYARWVIDAAAIYVIVMRIVKTLALPRGEEAGTASGSPGAATVAQAHTLDALAQGGLVEESRARRLVRSVRVVLSFWLLSHYVPLTVWELTGPSVIWWLADRVFWVALVVLVYTVLWWWRDDIAQGFERLAGERLPRATVIVREHRNRPYGVLLIGLASIYVAVAELARWVRAYVVETELSRQISNFIFRKKIEIQRREGGVAEVPEAAQSTVPERYRSLFADRPLYDETVRVDRRGVADAIAARRESWTKVRRKGSMAIVGEAGLGKTSELVEVVRAWPAEHGPVQYATLAQKISGEPAALELIAQLFHLPEVPTCREEAVEWLRRTPPRTIVLDDCHHLFLRHIGGFRAVDLFLDVVHITDDHHFWVLVFNRFAWSYLNRVRARKHYFGLVHEVAPWSEQQIQQLVRSRDAKIDLPISFTDLVVAHQSGEFSYEVIKTANGYFRLLHEFSQGNPRVALTFWLRSLRMDASGRLQVGLFSRPATAVQQSLTDQYLFALAAIVQHGSLNAEQVARITNSDRGFCETAINFLYESDILEVCQRQGRATLSTLYFRAVLRQLRDANFLYE